MAFGKNPENLGNVGSFRQMGHAFNQQKAESKQFKKGGTVPSWINEYKPPTTQLDSIRIIPGNYDVEMADGNGGVQVMHGMPFFPYCEHYDARSKKRSICSAGPHANDRNKRDACHGCDLFWSSRKVNPTTGKTERGFMGKRDMVAFTVIHYHNYHKSPQIQANGAPRLNPNTAQPYYSWVRCEKTDGRGNCDMCNAGHEIKFGHRMHWSMGADHYNTLLAKDEEIGRCCAGCGGRDTIIVDAWLCANPDCGDAIVDLSTTRLKDADIQALVSREARCPHCQQMSLPIANISCSNCSTPKQATLFDVDLKIRRIDAPDGSNRTTLSISNFSDPRPIDKTLSELAKPEALDKIYSPTPLEMQALHFQVTDTANTVGRQPVTAADAAKPYGARPGTGPRY